MHIFRRAASAPAQSDEGPFKPQIAKAEIGIISTDRAGVIVAFADDARVRISPERYHFDGHSPSIRIRAWGIEVRRHPGAESQC